MHGKVTVDITKSIADSKDVKPNELEVVLNEHMDLDAVEQLAKHSDSTWRLEFELPKHSVTVKSNGEILVDGQRKRNWASD